MRQILVHRWLTDCHDVVSLKLEMAAGAAEADGRGDDGGLRLDCRRPRAKPFITSSSACLKSEGSEWSEWVHEKWKDVS